ncbi:MAG: NfeD family protein [Desulfuromonadaceae bacterium]|nr:NfeD family protein [Desulfuromonadaceae bacterium]MDD2847220.1 NfeD family protein [Desulfuromonadaceae bacterium]MDD4130164.1 NfeD family protein [Desulfuromonadaceae bacterium]
MVKVFSDFNGLEIFFLICAVIGGFFVVVKLVLQFIGSDAGTDINVDGDIDIDHADSDIGFRFLSLQGLSAFFMMFGLVGLALYRQSQTGIIISSIGAVAAGMASVWVIAKLFQGAARLQSTGTLKTEDAVGYTGTVYLTIPQGGTGQVNLNFRNHHREFNATEKNGAEVPTGTPVRVVKVNANILVVETIS